MESLRWLICEQKLTWPEFRAHLNSYDLLILKGRKLK